MSCLSIVENILSTKIIGTLLDMNINLYIAYYKDVDSERAKEIDMCLRLNCRNKIFRKIYVFSEIGTDIPFLPVDDRIIIIAEGRLKFCDFFKYSNKFTEESTLNVLINSDVIIGEGIEKLLLEPKYAVCLTRYEISDQNLDVIISVGTGSHDCWIWKGKMMENIGDFYMGKYHCDGVLAAEMNSCGYILKNPVYGLKTYHVHNTGVRNYSTDYKVRGTRKAVLFSDNDNFFLETDTFYEGYTS